MNARDVFINCPFSADYRLLLEAIVFSINRSGFVSRCALETDDGGQVRFEKICRIVSECRFGVHDISMTELDSSSGLPRFNMPLELGLFLGALKFGGRSQTGKRTLILDREPFRYQTFISDIAGQDIHAHGSAAGRLIEIVCAWLRSEAHDPAVPGGRAIAAEFQRFQGGLDAVAASKQLARDELTFSDLTAIAIEWIHAECGSP